MRPRHPHIHRLPRAWLMTDERMGEGLWRALERLPRGSGVVFRHYALPAKERRAIFAKVAHVAKRRRLMLVVAAPWGPAGHVHGRGQARGWRTAAAHTRREAVAAIRAGADALFVSPMHATRSHPGARTLGPARLGLLVRGLGVPVIALGGMDARRFRALRPLGVYGWAAIDAWLA